MIDAEYKFGAFKPIIPEIYKALANDDNETLPGDSNCAIGNHWIKLKLIKITAYNDDTSIFEFELPTNHKYLNLPLTAHLLIKAPNCEHNNGGDAVRPYTSISSPTKQNTFEIMIKKYKEWGIKESELKQTNMVFLFTKTDHSYKPAGAVSNYIHNLNLGDYLEFKHSQECIGKIKYPFDSSITHITMCAVGAGIAPMIRIIRELLESKSKIQCIRLLYGCRNVKDILLREKLDEWHNEYSNSNRFKVIYCIGSRYANVHFGAKKSLEYEKPELPRDYEIIPNDRKELGWITGDKVKKHAATQVVDNHRIFICGLPGIYIALAGKRNDPKVAQDSQLYRLGYRDHHVIKF